MTATNRSRATLALIVWALSTPAYAQSTPSPSTSSLVVWDAHRAPARSTLIAAAIAHATPAALSRANQHDARRVSRGCRNKLLWGLGIGAGVGAAFGVAVGRTIEEPGKFFAASTIGFGLIGLAVGYNACN